LHQSIRVGQLGGPPTDFRLGGGHAAARPFVSGPNSPPESKGLAARRCEPHPLSPERHRASRWIDHLSGRGSSPRGGVGRRIRPGSDLALTRTCGKAPTGVDFVARSGSTTGFVGVPGSWSGPSRATTLGRASIGPERRMHSRFPVNMPSLVRLLRDVRAEIKDSRRQGSACNSGAGFGVVATRDLSGKKVWEQTDTAML